MEIYHHDTPETIANKNNRTELDNWIGHLEYIDKEIDNLLKLMDLNLPAASRKNTVVTKFLRKRDENLETLTTFQNYRNVITKQEECEDVACDMYFVREHEKYRKIYQYHVEKYRRIKEECFNVMLRKSKLSESAKRQ